MQCPSFFFEKTSQSRISWIDNYLWSIKCNIKPSTQTGWIPIDQRQDSYMITNVNPSLLKQFLLIFFIHYGYAKMLHKDFLLIKSLTNKQKIPDRLSRFWATIMPTTECVCKTPSPLISDIWGRRSRSSILESPESACPKKCMLNMKVKKSHFWSNWQELHYRQTEEQRPKTMERQWESGYTFTG